MIFEPHAYQQYCIQKILDIPKLGLFLDMGLGKTIITLSAIRQLMYDRFQVCRVLIIAPKKVAEGTRRSIFWTAVSAWESGIRISASGIFSRANGVTQGRFTAMRRNLAARTAFCTAFRISASA